MLAPQKKKEKKRERLKSTQPRAAKKISNMQTIFSLGRKKQIERLYLFLDTVELQHLYDERSCASFVLDGPQQGPHVVHAEGLGPAPVPPALDADVEQLERGPERETQTHQRQKTPEMRG